jgi:glycosyltransferase involved in cell wall biosynthesis
MSEANQLHVQTDSCLIFLWCIAYIQLEREMCLFLFLLIQQNFIILRLNICDGTAVFCSFARQRNFKWKITKSTFLVVYIQHYYIDNQFNVSFTKNSLRHFYGKYLMMKNVFVDFNENGYFYAGWHSKNNKQKKKFWKPFIFLAELKIMQIFVLFTSFSFHLIFQTMLTLSRDCDHYKIAKKESSFLGKKRKKKLRNYFSPCFWELVWLLGRYLIRVYFCKLTNVAFNGCWKGLQVIKVRIVHLV